MSSGLAPAKPARSRGVDETNCGWTGAPNAGMAEELKRSWGRCDRGAGERVGAHGSDEASDGGAADGLDPIIAPAGGASEAEAAGELGHTHARAHYQRENRREENTLKRGAVELGEDAADSEGRMQRAALRWSGWAVARVTIEGA